MLPRQLAEREHDTRKLLLAQWVKRIALVLILCSGTHQSRFSAASIAPYACVVAGSEYLTSNFVCLLHQSVELDVSIALDARIRRTAVLVFIHEIINHSLLEFTLEIDNVIRNA